MSEKCRDGDINAMYNIRNDKIHEASERWSNNKEVRQMTMSYLYHVPSH